MYFYVCNGLFSVLSDPIIQSRQTGYIFKNFKLNTCKIGFNCENSVIPERYKSKINEEHFNFGE